jgi:hypothetical protein
MDRRHSPPGEPESDAARQADEKLSNTSHEHSAKIAEFAMDKPSDEVL